jgi:hypothetical protein
MEEKGKSDLVHRLYYEGSQKSKIDRRYLIGADLGHRGWFMNYGKERYFRTNYKTILRDDEIVYFNERVFDLPQKIVWRQTSDRIRATIIGPYWFANTLQAGILKNNAYDLRYVLGLMNSRFLNFLYIESVKESGRVFPQMKLGKLKGLPLKSVDFSDPAEKSRYQGVVDLAQRMLDLHERLPKARTDHERTALSRQIEHTDAEIDRLVYELYGLSEEEIALVESATK